MLFQSYAHSPDQLIRSIRVDWFHLLLPSLLLLLLPLLFPRLQTSRLASKSTGAPRITQRKTVKYTLA